MNETPTKNTIKHRQKFKELHAKRFVDLWAKRRELRHEIYSIEGEVWEIIIKSRWSLTKKEYAIFKMRFHERRSLEYVGRELGVTRERIRQLERNLLKKLGINL